MANLTIHKFICGDDNYGVLVHDSSTGTTISVDAPDAKAVTVELKRRGWQLTHILTTHHHADHVKGNLELKHEYGCQIFGPEAEKDRIPGIGKTFAGGDSFVIADRKVKVHACPGHTLGHIAYHFEEDYLLLAGDTIFAMGCGRVIEGDMVQMHASVNKFRTLHGITQIYCGHEYTLANARFAMAMEPGNRALAARFDVVSAQRERGEMTLPTTIGEELKTNPFMRCDSAEIRKTLDMESASDAEVFAALRERKNNF
jgi:hydroxyacylglutathione hydrolase